MSRFQKIGIGWIVLCLATTFPSEVAPAPASFPSVTTSGRRSAEGDHPVSLGRLAVGNLSALASNPWTYAEWDKYFWSALDIAQNLLSTYVITDTFVNQIKEKRQVRYIKYRIAVLRELVQELVDDLVVQGAAESRQLVTIPPCVELDGDEVSDDLVEKRGKTRTPRSGWTEAFSRNKFHGVGRTFETINVTAVLETVLNVWAYASVPITLYATVSDIQGVTNLKRFLYYTPTTEIGAEFDEIRQELGNLRQVVQRQTLLSSVQSASSRTCVEEVDWNRGDTAQSWTSRRSRRSRRSSAWRTLPIFETLSPYWDYVNVGLTILGYVADSLFFIQPDEKPELIEDTSRRVAELEDDVIALSDDLDRMPLPPSWIATPFCSSDGLIRLKEPSQQRRNAGKLPSPSLRKGSRRSPRHVASRFLLSIYDQFFAVWEYASRFSAIYATVVDGIAASQIEKDPEARQAEQDLVEQYNQVTAKVIDLRNIVGRKALLSRQAFC